MPMRISFGRCIEDYRNSELASYQLTCGLYGGLAMVMICRVIDEYKNILEQNTGQAVTISFSAINDVYCI